MKKLIKNFIFVITVVIISLTVGASANAEKWEDYEYTILDNGTVEITLYTGNESALEIPAEIDGKAVTVIGDNAFFDCHSVVEVVIPDSVTTIGSKAFTRCLRMTDITIPDSVTTINGFAFAGCVSLNEVFIPASVRTIDEFAFTTCFGLREVVISDGVENIGYGAFSILPFLEKITIKSMDVTLEAESLCSNSARVPVMSRDDFVDLAVQCMITDDMDLWLKLDENMEVYDKTLYLGTIVCHPGSTTEEYINKIDVNYLITHFFGDWTYDYDKMTRTRKCSICDEIEAEELKTETDNNVEVVVPGNSDTKVEVDEVEKNSSNYILVENKLSEVVDSNFEILKVFDINLKNSDGVHVKADGTVKVKLPLDWEKDGDYKVYRVNDDGTLTDMNAYRQGSHMVFDTDHFSIYVIIEENVQEESPESTPDEEKVDFISKFFSWLEYLIDLILSWLKI